MATHSPVPTQTAIATQAPQEEPTPTATPVIVTPLAKAAYFTFAGWSLDSQWIAYWASTQEDIEQWRPYTMPGGTLHFARISTGEICTVDTLHTETDREAAVYWQAGNRVGVVMPDGALAGQPCGPFEQLPDGSPLPDAIEDVTLSPDGRYLVVEGNIPGLWQSGLFVLER